jgi:Flp pilus assembly protein TadG
MPTKHPAHERGANLVEAAIVIPLLLIIVVGLADLGRLYFTYITIVNAAREGARYAAGHPLNEAGITSACLAEAQKESQDSKPLVSIDSCDRQPLGSQETGDPVKVTASTQFISFLAALGGRPSFTISYSVTFPIQCEDWGCN